MAEFVVSIVLQSVTDLLVNEARFLYGVREQVEDAKTQLQQIRCFLEDADARARQGDKVFRNYVDEIRESAYDLEDIVATFALKAAIGRVEGNNYVLPRFACILIDLRKIGSKIEKISAKLSKSRLNFQENGLIRSMGNPSSSSSTDNERGDYRRTFSHTIDHVFVGFEQNIEELVMHLTKEEASLQVVSICGMGGLGKTTLARKVYYHRDVRHHFDCFAWASISQQCHPRDVWEGILIDLISPSLVERKEIRGMKDHEIAKKLYGVQTQKKCLVTLDDIWTSSTWDSLKAAFPTVNSHSKVLLTTRNRDVAFYADRRSILHEPKCFDEGESWALFHMKIHLDNSVINLDDDKIMKTLAGQMLEYCGGLPLAITVLGGLLSSKPTVEEWKMLHKNIKMYIRKGKITEHEDSKNTGVSWVLGLSYDDLPYSLKPCFLYFSYFPEDFEVRVRDLCRIWMAEGFVSEEDKAYECLSQLVERCLIQVEKSGSTGRIKTCRIHDLMRDLCLSKARDENFLKAVDFRNLNEASTSSSSPSCMERDLLPVYKVRRLAIYLSNNGADESLPLMKDKDRCLRSLICFNQEPETPYKEVMTPLLGQFLRVLKFENLTCSHVGMLPKEIGKLIHLRLFSLKDSYVKNLPSSIGNLRCLQTLDLRVKQVYGASKKLLETVIPPVIWKLVELRHLYLPKRYTVAFQYSIQQRLLRKEAPYLVTEDRLQLEKLHNLQTLVDVLVRFYSLNAFEKLTNLTKLKINLGSDFYSREISFSRLRSLAICYTHPDYDPHISEDTRRRRNAHHGFNDADIKSVILSCPRISKLHVEVPLRSLPHHDHFSPNLIKLTLVETCLEQDPMAILERLPSLKILLLDYDSFVHDTMVCTRGGFPRLESLSICFLNHFRVWKVEEGALPSLRRLHIVNCLRLNTLPDGLIYVITLEELVIQHMLKKFKKRVERGGVDFYKVEHVPSLTFMNTLF